ncbi:MAG: helix-turn-helix transcriptional regulator [Eubacteriales bacterium]
MSELSILLGKKIRTLRAEKDITQETLAELADLNTTYIGQIERGMKSPTLDTLGKISNAFEITPAELLTFTSHTHTTQYELALRQLLLEYTEKIKALNHTDL